MLNVLVVDDDILDREYAATVFREHGDMVTTAPDGEAAIGLVSTVHPDVVVSDVLMPRLDGYQLCRTLRETEENDSTTFVFYTATYTDSDDMALGAMLGADAYLTKPLDPGELLAGVTRAVDAHRTGAVQRPDAASDTAYDEAVVRKLEHTVTRLEAVNRTAARYRLLFETCPDPIVFLAADGHVIEANPAAELRLAGDDATLPGVIFRSDEGVGLPGVELDRLLTVLHDPPQVRFQSTCTTSENLTFPCEVVGAAIDLGGETVAMALLRDLTQQRAREKELRVLLAQQRSLAMSAVRALAKTVETRDPYTAGHQERVGNLAAAIAGRLHRSVEERRVIRLAGLVHDVGKVYVPAEILTRPGKITSLELDLIRTHVEVGHEILSAIRFPWPIAEWEYQHHERLDGSGYPRGLAGEQICLEARILAVADVIEAMTFHRPYKSVAGLDAAIEEIADGAGTLYDAEVAAAAVALFTEDGYRFGAPAPELDEDAVA
jgi:putative nucleotidyltransferase with HDIG domain